MEEEKVIGQKQRIRKIQKLRDSARDAPQCFACGKPNDGTLVLAHSNSLSHGRGSYHKSPDYFGAIVCSLCHDRIDGRAGGLSKEEKRDMHQRAHDATLTYWIEMEILK